MLSRSTDSTNHQHITPHSLSASLSQQLLPLMLILPQHLPVLKPALAQQHLQPQLPLQQLVVGNLTPAQVEVGEPTQVLQLKQAPVTPQKP